MYIRKSTIEDIEKIMSIYESAREFMAANGNPNQWCINHWPPEELIRQDIAIGKSYVCIENDDIVGTFFYDFGKDIESTYAVIHEGSWKSDKPYGVVHRIAGNSKVKGIGKFCFDWAFEQCGHIRVDTHGDNKVLQNLLAKLGYEYRGIIFVKQDNFPRLAYEKCI